MEKRKLAVLISGSGSNLQALIDACAKPNYPAEIVTVISNRADAFGLQRAQKANIVSQVISHREFATRQMFDEVLHETLDASGAEFICLAGFMRLLTPEFVKKWEGRILNIHPSLLPAFKGLHTHRAAIETGVRFAGCSVHFVSAELDSGPIIIQAAVPVLPEDTEETLAARVLAEEHRCYPEAVKLLCEGRLAIDNGRVRIVGHHCADTALLNPAVTK